MNNLEGNALGSVKAIWVKYRYHHPIWAMVHATLIISTAGGWALFFLWNWWAFYTGVEELPKTEEVECPSCGNEVDDSMEFCPSCGTDVEKLPETEEIGCPSCGHEAEASMTFCPSCGTKINSEG